MNLNIPVHSTSQEDWGKGLNWLCLEAIRKPEKESFTNVWPIYLEMFEIKWLIWTFIDVPQIIHLTFALLMWKDLYWSLFNLSALSVAASLNSLYITDSVLKFVIEKV